MILPIYLDPQPVLRQKTNEHGLDEIKTADFQQLIEDLVETMRNAAGIGLAAPQMGLSKRLAVVDLKETDNRLKQKHAGADFLVLVNPYIKRKSFRNCLMEEGCLSIPGVYGKVKRPVAVTINYADQQGLEQSLRVDGLLSRVIQHELDHLDGVLFTDKVRTYTSTTRTIPEYPHI